MSSTPDKMTALAAEHWKVAQRLHMELRIKLKEKDSGINDIEDLIEQIRIACERTQFADFDYATDQGVDGVLWDAHGLIHSRYRKINNKFKASEQKKTVERRKWEKRYADFLKKSQFYYKGYIQRMASQFDCLKELRIIAHRLSLSTLSVEHASHLSQKTQENILHSCHFALLRLGDLHRYRNDLNVKDRSWDKAIAHYALANDLRPDAGTAFNQMAVISLADSNHLDAVYHLYRALAVNEPHSLAESNLEIEFKKINSLWTGAGKSNRRTSNVSSESRGQEASMVLWFVRLHAMLYKGEEFSAHDDMENEVLSQMSVILKEQSLEDVLDKIVLINIAAEYFAGVRLTATGSDNCFQAYYFYLRLNIRMMFMLSELLQKELDGESQGQDLPGASARSTETITVVTRRILPALRHYSTWLTATAPVIASQIGTASINVHIRELWDSYCRMLSLLVEAFPVQHLKDVDYLLEEDSATVGFKPFRDSKECWLYSDDHGDLKKRSTDPGVERHHPNKEMEARIRGLVKDGIILATAELNGVKRYPIYKLGDKFRFCEEPPNTPARRASMESIIRPSIPSNYEQNTQFIQGDYAPSVDPSESQQSLYRDMHQMVDDLLTPIKQNSASRPANDSPYGGFDQFANPPGGFHPLHHNASPMHRRISGFPGLTSAFAPLPGELGPNGPAASFQNARNPITTGQSSSPHRFGMNQHWSPHDLTPPGPPHMAQHNLRQQPLPNQQLNVAQELQKSLMAEYQAPGLSGFSNTSSLYQNTQMPGFPPQQMWNDSSAQQQQQQQHLGRRDQQEYHR